MKNEYKNNDGQFVRFRIIWIFLKVIFADKNVSLGVHCPSLYFDCFYFLPYLWHQTLLLNINHKWKQKFEEIWLHKTLDHVLLLILSNDTRLLQCSLCAEQRKKNQWLAMFCLYTLPLARPAQAKIQMLTAISSIVKLISWSEVNLSHL